VTSAFEIIHLLFDHLWGVFAQISRFLQGFLQLGVKFWLLRGSGRANRFRARRMSFARTRADIGQLFLPGHRKGPFAPPPKSAGRGRGLGSEYGAGVHWGGGPKSDFWCGIDGRIVVNGPGTFVRKFASTAGYRRQRSRRMNVWC